MAVPTSKGETQMRQPKSPHAISVAEVASAIVEKRDAVAAEIEDLVSLGKQTKALVDRSTAKSTKKLRRELAELDRQLDGHLTRYRRTFQRYWGRTVELSNAIIKWYVIPRSLQTPQDVTPIIQSLLEMPDGIQYLNIEYTLDRRALAAAPPSLLRRLGMSNHRQEQLSVMPTDADGTPRYEKPVVLRKRRYPAPPRAKD